VPTADLVPARQHVHYRGVAATEAALALHPDQLLPTTTDLVTGRPISVFTLYALPACHEPQGMAGAPRRCGSCTWGSGTSSAPCTVPKLDAGL
jgi:hypothetical protein